MDSLDKLYNGHKLNDNEIKQCVDYFITIIEEKYQVKPNIKIISDNRLVENCQVMGFCKQEGDELILFLNACYYRQNFSKYNHPNLLFIYTLIHEYWHIIQNKNIKNTIKKGRFNSADYQILNNFIAIDLDYDYYIENHQYFESEIDAYINTDKIMLDYNFFKNHNYNFIINKNSHEEKRYDQEYLIVNDFLNNVDLKKNGSNLFNSFTLMEYLYLKNASVSQIIDFREELCESIIENMICNQDYENNVKNFQTTFNFFDYLINKKIKNYNPDEINHLVNNIRYDTALKLKEVLIRSDYEKSYLKIK